MTEWEPIFKQILEPVDFLKEEKMDLFRKMMRQRAEEISDILIGLSKHKLEETYFEFGKLAYRPRFKNIKTNEDFAREEFRGAVQRYLLGMDEDSLIHACIALEAGLLVKDDEKLKNGELKKKDIRLPFTLGKNMGLWLPKSKTNRYGKGFIKDEAIIEQLKRAKLTRDCHIHGFNFIASLVLWLKSGLTEYRFGAEFLESIKAILEKTRDEELLEEIKKIRDFLPSELHDQIGPFLHPEAIRMILSDVMSGFKTIENLSDFRWCAQEEALKLVKERIERYGLAVGFFQSVAKETLYDTYAVLRHIDIV